MILGIDPSLNSLGYAILSAKDQTMKIVHFGFISHAKDADLYRKIGTIYQVISSLISEYKPHIVAMEETFVNSNPRSSLKLGMARGACISAAISPSVKHIVEYEPRFIKKNITGNGAADKNQITYMLKHLIPTFAPTQDDESDAAAVAITAYLQLGGSISM